MNLRLHETHFIVLCILFALMMSPVSANAAATKEKCTCDLETAHDSRNGARVSNAAKCFLVSDEERNWCIFDIELLESTQVFEEQVQFDTQLKTFVEDEDYDELTQLIGDHFESWTTWGGGASFLYELGDIHPNTLGPTLSTIIFKSKNTVVQCLKDFVASDQGGIGELMQSDMLGCGVHQNGWLTFKLDMNGFSVYYLREPLHENSR